MPGAGRSPWVVDQLPVETLSPLLLAGGLAAATAALSNVMSNTAAANVVIPMALALAPGNEALVVVPVALAASSAMCLPVSTPPNAIVFATGELAAKDFLVGGMVVGVLGLAVGVGWSWLLLS